MSRARCRRRSRGRPRGSRWHAPMTAARPRPREWRPAERRAEDLSASRRRAWLAAVLCATLGAALSAAPARAGTVGSDGRRGQATALVAFLPARGGEDLAGELARVPRLSLGILS